MAGKVPVTAVNGKVVIESISGPMEGDEESLVVSEASKDGAVSIGVAKTDMEGGESGNATSVNANQAIYFMTSKDIQQEFIPYIVETFKMLGINVEGFKSAAELDANEKLTQMASLSDLYTRCAPELKEAIAERLQSFFKSEFGQDVIITVQEEIEDDGTTDPSGIESKGGIREKVKGFFGRNPKGVKGKA
jgi:hypothetical protein